MQYDIAIVGAGIAGLTAARALHDAGRSVIVIDKSRGLGGRLATRRLGHSHADHGVCYLKANHPAFQSWLDHLTERGLINVWTDRLHHPDLTPEHTSTPRYVAPDGATAIAKDLAAGLTLERNQLITVVNPIADAWQLLSQNTTIQNTTIQNTTGPITAKTVILAIPAPQAVPLIEAIAAPEVLEQIRSIAFAPCLTAIAVYPAAHLAQAQTIGIQGIQFIGDDESLGWIGFEHTKQHQFTQPILVIQSNKMFVKEHFESTDLPSIGKQLCDRAAKILKTDWITQPEILQVHRWKYAFVINPLAVPFLRINTINTAQSPDRHSLYCIGDWCGGNRVESAFLSGRAIAQHILNA
jgi:renalase